MTGIESMPTTVYNRGCIRDVCESEVVKSINRFIHGMGKLKRNTEYFYSFSLDYRLGKNRFIWKRRFSPLLKYYLRKFVKVDKRLGTIKI